MRKMSQPSGPEVMVHEVREEHKGVQIVSFPAWKVVSMFLVAAVVADEVQTREGSK